MKEFDICVKCPAMNAEQARQVKMAFETMVKDFGAEGIVKLERRFKKDLLVRTMVRASIHS